MIKNRFKTVKKIEYFENVHAVLLLVYSLEKLTYVYPDPRFKLLIAASFVVAK